jgi:FAD/FMN-containing dehydrogenase
MPYTAFQAIIDPLAPKGYRSYWRGEYLDRLSDAALDTFAAHAPNVASLGAPLSQMIVFRIGQGVTATPDDATAFSHRDARYMFHPITVWSRPEDDERMIAATRALCDAMRPFATGGAYLNFSPENRVRDAYGAAKYARLVALKDRYDPDNLFRMNQNIAPSRGAGQPALA